jgi:hypothetical protein
LRRAAALLLAIGLCLGCTVRAAPLAAAPPVSVPPASPGFPSGFSTWAAVVVAGDAHAHSGAASEAFDNARRDVGRALLSAGFEPSNLRELSTRPRRYRERPGLATVDNLYETLSQVAAQAPGGCLVYLSSHGAPEGAVVGEDLLAPSVLGAMLDQACGERPTIAVVSACFSGVFVPALASRNRMILTAARPDRSSFGCGESDRYPYFDACFLQAFGAAHDFVQLGRMAQACVAAREVETHMSPPSEPQLWVGAALKPLLMLYRLPGPAADRPPTR